MLEFLIHDVVMKAKLLGKKLGLVLYSNISTELGSLSMEVCFLDESIVRSLTSVYAVSLVYWCIAAIFSSILSEVKVFGSFLGFVVRCYFFCACSFFLWSLKAIAAVTFFLVTGFMPVY